MIAKKLGLLTIALTAAVVALSMPVSVNNGTVAMNAAIARGNDDLSDLRDFICRRHPHFCEP